MVAVVNTAQYTNNDPVSANIEVPTITILDWDNVKTVDKTAIHTIATLEGFTVV